MIGSIGLKWVSNTDKHFIYLLSIEYYICHSFVENGVSYTYMFGYA